MLSKNYAWQNIDSLIDYCEPIVKELIFANQYKPGLTYTLLQQVNSNCLVEGEFSFNVLMKIQEV